MKFMCVLALAALAGTTQAGFFSEVEDNNSLANANDLGSFGFPGASMLVDGAIGDADVDWFSFTLTDTASFTIFAAFSASSGADGLMQLVTGAGDVIAFDDDSGPGLMPAIQYENLAAGSYFVGLSGFGDVDSSSVDSDELADGLGHQENFGYKLTLGLTITPAPGSVALLGMGGLVATRRRR